MADWGLIALIFIAAVAYATVGHGGASGYLAAMALFEVTPALMKPSALVLNIAVASLGLVRWTRATRFDWRLFWPLALTSIPFAYLGGAQTLAAPLYKYLIAATLAVAALRLIIQTQDRPALTHPPYWQALPIGAVLGWLAGATGVGGGIFLSPLLLFFRWADMRASAPIAAAFILVNSIAGLLGQWPQVSAWSPALLPWLIAAVAGAAIGSELGVRRLAPPRLRQVLGAVLLLAAIKLIASAH